MENLAVAKARLHAAVVSECWTEACGLLPEYARLLEVALRQAGAGPEGQILAQDAAELFAFARRMALASRAQAAAQLTGLERQSQYEPRAGRRSRWEIEG